MQAAQEACRHPPPPSFAAGYLSQVYYHILIAQHPFPSASHSSSPSTFPIPTTPCSTAPDPVSTFMPPVLHPLLCPMLSHSLSLPTYPRAFLTSSLTLPSPELLTSNLLFYSSTSRSCGGQKEIGVGQDGHATTARKHTHEAGNREEEAVRVGRIWIKRRL